MIEHSKYIFLGLSVTLRIIVFSLSFNLKKTSFHFISLIVSILLLVIGLLCESFNLFNLPKGLTTLIPSLTFLFITLFDNLNRLFYKINGYYPWSQEFDYLAYLSKTKPDRFINKPKPKKHSHFSNMIFQTSLFFRFPLLILGLVILTTILKKQ